MEELSVIRLPEMKVIEDNFEIDFKIEMEVTEPNYNGNINKREKVIFDGINEVNASLAHNERRLDELNKEIDILTNHADGIDYMVAVGSGILAGLIDSFVIGEFNFERGNNSSDKTVNNFVVKIAQLKGYKGDDLKGAIMYLEGRAHIPSDSNTNDFGGGPQHHLRDFSHHPNISGLMFSLLTQFTEKAYGTNNNGLFMIVDIKNKALIGSNLPEKLSIGIVKWFFHMVSDMAGSSSYPGGGTGLPGPLLSLAKQLSVLPFFRNIKVGDNTLSEWVFKLFNKFDLRGELGLLSELSRQAIPVIINECLVRGFYFIRRLAAEIKEKDIRHINELDRVDWDRVKPFKNRTIVRMLTIATGTFTLIDLGDAAIRGAIKSGGNPGMFASEFLLRVNFVGVGRFAVAVTTDIAMGIKRGKLRNERLVIMSEQLHLMNAKIFYLQASTWTAAETTEKTINEAIEMAEQTVIIYIDTWNANRQSLHNIGDYRSGIEERNPKLIDNINDILKWG